MHNIWMNNTAKIGQKHSLDCIGRQVEYGGMSMKSNNLETDGTAPRWEQGGLGPALLEY
jgi:hypothetical protein